MKDNLLTFNQVGITVPVILGGAALTPRFVHGDCRAAYRGQVIYGRDAFADLRFMDALMEAKAAGRWDDARGFLDGPPEGLAWGGEVPASQAASPAPPADGDGEVAGDQPAGGANHERSEAVPEEPALQPPFWGSAEIREEAIDLPSVMA